MPNEISKNLYIPLKLITIRILTIGLFISCYKKINIITKHALLSFNNPLLLFSIMLECNYFKYFKNSQFRTFTLILLLFTSFTQILRTLLKDVDTDTTLFCYILCQIIFCIDSSGTSLISQKAKTKEFSRSEAISLEEGLLIPLKREYTGGLGSFAMLIGCFCLFSRLESNMEMLVLQWIGFILYFFIPFYIEKHNLNTFRFIVSVAIFYSLIFLIDKEMFNLFTIILFGSLFFIYLTIEILKKLPDNF